MNCKVIARNIDAYVDGELSDAKTAQIQTHVKDCPSCQRLYESASASLVHVMAEEPQFLKSKVKDSISTNNAARVPLRSNSLRFGFATAIAAAIMVVALLAVPTPAVAKWSSVARSLQGIRSVYIEFRYPDEQGSTKIGMSGIARASWESPAGGGLTTDEGNVLVWRWDAAPVAELDPSDFIGDMGQGDAPGESRETKVFGGKEYFVFRVAAGSLPIDKALEGEGEWEILVDPESQLPEMCQLAGEDGHIVFQAFLNYNIVERKEEWSAMVSSLGERMGYGQPWQPFN